jgi:hypothetical protein
MHDLQASWGGVGLVPQKRIQVAVEVFVCCAWGIEQMHTIDANGAPTL